MFLRQKERVPLISPALESAIVMAKWSLIPCIAVFAEGSLLNNYLGHKSMVRGWALTGCIALFAVQLLLIRLPTISKGLDKAISQIKRRAVLSCPQVSARDDSEWRPACWLIPEQYKQPLFRYDTQQHVVEQIIRRLADEKEKAARFVYIEGESGKGKTRTIFLLLHALLKHPRLSPLADRAFLYDMAGGHAVQSLLCRRLDSSDHDAALAFVDNFHQVEPEFLRSITQKLLDTAALNSERLVVLLGQPSHAWRIRPTAEIRLLSTARRNSVYFVLGGVPSSLLAEELMGRPGAELWRSVFGRAVTGTASVPQLYFAQITGKTATQASLLRELLELIEGASHSGEHRTALLRLIAIVTALSLFRGSFKQRDFLRVCWTISRDLPGPRRLLTCFTMHFLLRRLTRIGFTPQQAIPHTQLVFHEAMAEHCKDRLEDDKEFWSWFTAAVQWRLSTVETRNDPVLQWLLSCEHHDAPTMAQVFDRALLNGTLSTMMRCLDRNWSSLQAFAGIGYQYALLLDSVGRFSESRRVFALLDARSVEELALSDRVQIARIEVEHGRDSAVQLSKIAERGDVATKMAAEYWKIHLDAHRGVFRPEALAQLAEKMSALANLHTHENSYFFMHTAARIFFDAHRHVYLAGERVEERLLRLQELPLEFMLRRQLPQFRALAILYREAHLLAHELLPELIFFGHRPALSSFSGKLLDDADATSDFVIKLARDSYSRAREEFSLYGDREFLYLQADSLNFEMLSEDSDQEIIRLKLIDYESFARKSAFSDLMSYPCFYFFRWHMLQYFRWLMRGDQRYAESAAEANIESGREYLQKALQLDASCGNAYGLWRSRFFLALLEGLTERTSEGMIGALSDSRAEAVQRGYWRDARLVQTLLDKSKITPLDVRRMILFFPFVHQ